MKAKLDRGSKVSIVIHRLQTAGDDGCTGFAPAGHDCPRFPRWSIMLTDAQKVVSRELVCDRHLADYPFADLIDEGSR